MISHIKACELAAAIYNPITPNTFTQVIDTDDITCGVAVIGDDTVFSFAGSENAEDWVRDFFAVQFCHPQLGTLHAGFWAGMGDAWVPLSAIARKAKKIVIVCHSLGCAHGAIFAGLCAKNGIAVDQLVMFAPPRVSYRTLRDIVHGWVKEVTGYRNGRDPVPMVPATIPIIEAWVDWVDQIIDEPPSDKNNLFEYHELALYLRGMRKKFAA